MRWLVLRQVLVQVESGGLLVRYLPAGREMIIDFAEVVSYRDEWLRDGRELSFKLRSGRDVKLAVNSFLGPTGDYHGLLRAVEDAMARFATEVAPGNKAAPIAREKSFYEKPFATGLLVAGVAALLVVAGAARWHGRPLQGNFLVAVSVVLSYAGLWYAARKSRAK